MRDDRKFFNYLLSLVRNYRIFFPKKTGSGLGFNPAVPVVGLRLRTISLVYVSN
jgi:hypothetical protein